MGRQKVDDNNKRKPHAVPFSDIEWDRICRAAVFKHLRPSNFIQQATLSLAEIILKGEKNETH